MREGGATPLVEFLGKIPGILEGFGKGEGSLLSYVESGDVVGSHTWRSHTPGTGTERPRLLSLTGDFWGYFGVFWVIATFRGAQFQVGKQWH